MAFKMQVPAELGSMDPENYRKYFRALCWSGTSKEKRSQKKIGKKEKHRLKTTNALAVCYAPVLLGNPSQFAVYASVRKSILARWRHLHVGLSELSDDSDNEDSSSQTSIIKLPKVTGIGLRTVFALISQARFTDAQFCEYALKALLDVLQGHASEELAQEPTEIISNLHAMLVEVATGSGPSGKIELPTTLTALSSSCLIALSVARGETELILNAAASLIMSSSSISEQYLQVPCNLTTLQRSVQSVILGTPSRNQWLNYGVPHQSLVTSFPVDLPTQLTAGSSELVVRSLVSDGCFLYVFTSKGLLKIGSGYGSSIRQHVYLYKPNFFASDRHGWLGYCKDKLYLRIGRKKTEIYEIDKETLEVRDMVQLEPGPQSPVNPRSAVFTDGNQLGLIQLSTYHNLAVKMYDTFDTQPERAGCSSPTTLKSRREFSVNLLRRRVLMLGTCPFDDGLPRRPLELDAPVAMQLDDCDEDRILTICSGQDFALLRTESGKVFYTGNGQSLGYKAGPSQAGRWTLMKDILFSRNDLPNAKKHKVKQVAVGHEGAHVVFVLDNGKTLFAGIARRGEDGDIARNRRAPKPTRPKNIFKAEGHYVTYAACNNGSTALVTKQGFLYMFGKDTQHCDTTGLVLGLRHEKIVQVALGKAHAVALTNFGQVYTFGINNKGQCGREFGYTKEKFFNAHRPPQSDDSDNKEETKLCTDTPHTWTTGFCRVCVLCRECTGFSSACHCSHLPNRVPGEKCGCGEGDSGCLVCGLCRRCADAFTIAGRPERSDMITDLDDDADTSSRETRNEQENVPFPAYEGHASASEGERDSSMKVTCLPPGRIALPGGHRIASIACGLHHTVLLTLSGDVLTFGSNQYGQLGAGDILAHHRIVRLRIPRAQTISAGSNHTVVQTVEGEVYTFGNYQKGSLGRPRVEEPTRTERGPIWYATPAPVPSLGLHNSCKVYGTSTSGDQTFVFVSQSVIKTDTLFSTTITANNNCIVILPNRPEHTFKCITINKNDGTCNAWTGAEQVDFVNTLACIDPLYDVLWCYQPQMKVMKCYNILAFDSHKIQKCFNADSDGYFGENEFEYPNYGSMKRLEDFKNMEKIDMTFNSESRPTENVALLKMSILNQELAIPCAAGCSVTRMHAALHLLGCLDSLIYAYDMKLNHFECKTENTSTPVAPVKEDFLIVNRFEGHGGGWGYSGHSIEAIRFMCDTDILVGGFGLFGGRGDYTAKIKLYDIGIEGGDQESDGELVTESDEVAFECAPRDRFPVLFDIPIPVMANKWYVAWASISGPSSDCGSSGQAMVINDDVGFHFKTSKKANNGTDVNAGQIPSILYHNVSADQSLPLRVIDLGEPVIQLSKSFSRKVTVPCFRSLITLLQWSWDAFKEIILETNGLIPINYIKLTVMKYQTRLVYVIRACLRLIKSYINEIYPQNNRKRNSTEYMSYVEAIADARNLVQDLMAEPTPSCSMLPKRPGKNKPHRVCYVQFALELTSSIMKEAHETITACFHAFFPTPTLKWNHLCFLLLYVREGLVPLSQIRELTATCAAMCVSRNLRDVLQYVAPVTQNALMTTESRRPSKVIKEVPSKSATVPRSSHAQKPPPVPPRSNQREARKKPVKAGNKPTHSQWHLLDVIPRLLDISMIPIKRKMMTRHCGKPHDHGHIKQHETLSDFCCKLTARIIAELSYSATNIREELDTNGVNHMITPSRFMRVNQSRAWNTGNGSPDAICFTVDRPGIVLAGVGVYGGLGSYEYSIELLHDVRQHMRSAVDEANPSNCWVSVEVTHGSFSADDCQHDIVQLKFNRPVALKEDVRYAVRLCNHGGRTSNGDCGLPSVKGPDDTTFRFASCSLSFNGTTLARGQIPCLIYFGTSKLLSNSLEIPTSLITALRALTVRVASLVLERGADMFCMLRNELTAEDLRRNASVLQRSPAITTLIPYTLASLEGLEDSNSMIKLLEMIHKLLPHVAAMNLLVPSVEETTTTTGHYYTWVESDHPYKQATVTNMRVLFPSTVSWVVLEMDPRSMTAQPEDSLTVYAVAGTPRQHCHCANDVRTADAPFKKRQIQLLNEGEVDIVDDGDSDVLCMHYNCTYVSVTPRLANDCHDWPQKSLLIPGNEVIFSLETASDYLTECNKTHDEASRYGFRCLCVGYEDAPQTSQRQGLLALETELVYAGAACASRLLAPDLDIAPLSYSTIMELQINAMAGSSTIGVEAETPHDGSEALFLSRGLDLSSPPTIHNVIDGQTLLRCVSAERQFLADFVNGVESSAGSRLACWLAPTSRVDPTKCELTAPLQPVRPGRRLTLPVVIRDQYGEPVSSPAMKVEVVVHRVDSGIRRSCSSQAIVRNANIPDVLYQPTVRESMCFHSITMMTPFQNYSFEELRLASESWGDGGAVGGSFSHTGRVAPERVVVRTKADGTYYAAWTPCVPGNYVFRCTLDDQYTSQELQIEVVESGLQGPSERAAVQAAEVLPPPTPTKQLRFIAKYSAGLRVRASPSLQAEELGRVPPDGNIYFVEEVSNKDGTWVRVGEESLRTYAENAEVAWCLQHSRHLDRALLVPIEPATPPQVVYPTWNEDGDAQGDMVNSIRVSDLPPLPPDEFMNEFDDSSVPYEAIEPSKRDRMARESLSCSPSPRRMRRNNGNNDEQSQNKQSSSENIGDVNMMQETEMVTEPNPEVQRCSRLAQTGTQTSPEGHGEDLSAIPTNMDPKAGMSSAYDRMPSHSRACQQLTSPPPPLPARAAPAPPPPRKQALSPAQAESLRAIFAALLWHEGLVHDAIACAAFLKFHPQLPKQGERVVTRPANDLAQAKQLRHSVEVSNAGYLRINPSTLETLERSGIEATTSRMRKTEIHVPIREEEAHCSDAGSSSSVVNVLPPALRALVALWDALYDADQLAAATDKKKETTEKNENEDMKSNCGRRRNERNPKTGKVSYLVRCELCCIKIVPPIVAHLPSGHPGCGGLTTKGYDRYGEYHIEDMLPNEVPLATCGKLSPGKWPGHGCKIYYMFCEKCYEKATRAATSIRQTRSKVIAEKSQFARDIPILDHHTMMENAVFLLDLAPLTNSEQMSACGGHESSRSPPTPPGSVWQPAPPFQCLPALGAAPRTLATTETARYHSLGRPPPPPLAPVTSASGGMETTAGGQAPRMHRSVSMGQAGGSDLAHAERPPLTKNAPVDQETIPVAGSSLLAQPSASLLRLIGVGEWTAGAGSVSAFESPQIDIEALMSNPVLSFILSKRDLHSHRQKMDAAIRINTVRQYAFEALHWLLRSATQPTCVHDVMWWFCNALDKFARIVPPPIAIDDNKENTANDNTRGVIPTASATAMCPGGRAARGSRAAFHAFLGSVSALASSLPPSSAAALQAVRCWALHYSPHDRMFLHRSQVFSVISKILSHSEDGAYEEGMLGALHESYHSYVNKENFVWSCQDVTGWCDVSVSSRQGIAGMLTDGTTETFWESGDEDRNKAKWIQVSYPGGTPDDRPHVVCLHIDNTRDTVNKTLLVSFLFSCGSNEMFHMQDVDVDPKSATWICYTIPRVTTDSLRVRCELRGPEPALRVRQVRVLGAPTPAPTSQTHLLHALAETDTLRVFRLLTSQVFGKLLEWDGSGSESGGEGTAPAAGDSTVVDDSDLREHVVGILFAGHKLTSLQRQVMSHIVCAIGGETARVRDDWETALLCAEAAERNEVPVRHPPHTQDNYCFEMLSLLLALSGSSPGRAHLAQQTELLADLLALLHTGSDRVQRQVISLLRRMITELPPQRMLAVLNDGKDHTIRVTLLDHLVCYLGKAITVQVKVKGVGAIGPGSVMMGSSVCTAPPATWFMRGETTKQHAHLVAKLLSDMSEDKICAIWGMETRKALAGYVSLVAQASESQRQPMNCIAAPTMWMALAVLVVCNQSHIDLINGSGDERESRRGESESSRALCANHDDGTTPAVIECRNCGPLCAECDRFLHLNKSARTHHRQICKEEESAIRMDIHEGCGRAKLFWLLLLIDRRTLKALAEFRGIDNGVCNGNGGDSNAVASGSSGPGGMCRFCGRRSSSGLLAIGNVCSDPQCQEHGRSACTRVLPCRHICGGVRDERTCLPCLHGCAGADQNKPLRQDADDMCMICFTDPLQAAPALQLKCGHVFHLHCCKKVLANNCIGPRITFSFSQCPICKEDMDHWTLEELLAPIRRRRDEVKRKALMRLEYEGLAAPGAARGHLTPDPATYAMERYAYYVCHKCNKAYFGGLARCEAETSGWWEPAELVCGACSDVSGARTCPKHGADFLEYKCRYCCSVAVFFCFGTSHFCNSCHDDFQRVTSIPKNMLPQCPAGPKGEQLPGTAEECPLHVQHPPTGEEFALGCGVCRNAHAF